MGQLKKSRHTHLLRLRYLVAAYLLGTKKSIFLRSIPMSGRLMDVGCGNNSPRKIKSARPDLSYVGIDIADPAAAKTPGEMTFILADPQNFASKIREAGDDFDAVLSSHNLEHCIDPEAVVIAMTGALKRGGRLYLSLPCEESVRFPSRQGTLNFYDDPEHRNPIPFEWLLALIRSNGMQIVSAVRRHRNPLLFFLGLICEPFSALLNRQAPFGATWALYGFESIIVAKKGS